MVDSNEQRLKRANLNSFVVLGFLEASWAPMVPFIKDRFGLDESQLGTLLMCTGIGSFFALPIINRLCAILGPKKVAISSGILMALALLSVAYGNNLYLTAAALFVFGMSTIGIDVATNINAVIVESILKRPLMSGFHGGYSIGTLGGAAFVSFLLTMGFSLGTSSLVVMCLMFACMYIGCRGLLDSLDAGAPAKEAEPTAQPQSAQSVFLPFKVIAVGALCFIMYSTEGAVMSWSAVFASQERGLSLEYAGFIYTAFAVSMTIMRLAGNRIVIRIGRCRTVVLGALLVALGFVIIVSLPFIAGTVLGFLIIGFGAANIVPQLVSFAGTIRECPVNRTISFINAFGYSGILLGPVIIGYTSKAYGLPATFMGIGTLALLVAFAAGALLSRRNASDL